MQQVNIGDVFHDLTVESQVGSYKKFNVICKCGTNLVVRQCNLLLGKKKSCGCMNYENILSGVKNRKKYKIERKLSVSVGQVVGRLTVVEKIQDKKEFLCKCECGNVKIIKYRYLRDGVTKSCGCLIKETSGITMSKNNIKRRSKKLTVSEGDKFGRLTVVSRSQDGRYKTLVCLCDCGNERVSTQSKLIKGYIRSCGCLRKDSAIETISKHQKNYRKSKGLDPDKNITYDGKILRAIFYEKIAKEVYKRDGYKCLYCGASRCALNAHHLEKWSDRPDLRFDIDNVATLCKDCHNEVHNQNYQGPVNEEMTEVLLKKLRSINNVA
jgi:5-methylcytosine-specific restriction endonuclease McrA